jgi:hypothetical protein
LIRIRLRAFDCFAPIVVNLEKRFKDPSPPSWADATIHQVPDDLSDVKWSLLQRQRQIIPVAALVGILLISR